MSKSQDGRAEAETCGGGEDPHTPGLGQVRIVTMTIKVVSARPRDLGVLRHLLSVFSQCSSPITDDGERNHLGDRHVGPLGDTKHFMYRFMARTPLNGTRLK